MADTAKTLYTRIAQLSFTTDEWSARSSSVLLKGEIGYDSTANKIKIGDGLKTWAQLNWISPDYTLPIATDSVLGGVKSGGDVTVNSSTGVMTVADATSSAHGLMTSAAFTKLAGISDGANKVEASSTNGHIKIDGSDTTVYTHPAHTSAASGFYKLAVDAEGHVSSTTAVAKSDLTTLLGAATSESDGYMTSAQASKLDGIAAGAQVNVLEGVSFKGSGDSDFSDLTITNKKAILDLSGYALKSDIAAALNFKGSKTGDQLAALTASDVANGDVYSCTADNTGASVTFHAGYEYAATLSGDPAVLTWVELGKYLDLSGYVEKTQTVNGKALTSDVTLYGDDIELSTSYAKASAAAAVAGSDKIDVAIGKLEYKLDANISATSANTSAITTLNGDDTTTGSVAKSIKDAIAGLDVSEISGDYITAVSEVDGKISATAGTKGTVASGVTALVDGGTVYAAISSATSGKADKVTSATSGHFAGLDANGNLTDSGKSASDFADATAFATHASDTDIHVTTNEKSAWNAKYDKPVAGIPSTDMTSEVQASLALADTAIQSVTGDTYVSATTTSGAVTLATSSKVVTTDNYVLIQCTLDGVPTV